MLAAFNMQLGWYRAGIAAGIAEFILAPPPAHDPQSEGHLASGPPRGPTGNKVGAFGVLRPGWVVAGIVGAGGAAVAKGRWPPVVADAKAGVMQR